MQNFLANNNFIYTTQNNDYEKINPFNLCYCPQ